MVSFSFVLLSFAVFLLSCVITFFSFNDFLLFCIIVFFESFIAVYVILCYACPTKAMLFLLFRKEESVMKPKIVLTWLLCLTLLVSPVYALEGFGIEGWDEESEVSFEEGMIEVASPLTDAFVSEEEMEAEAVAEGEEALEEYAWECFGESFATIASEEMFAYEESEEDALVGIDYMPLSVNQTITQRLSDNKEVDWYALTVPSAGTISLSFSHEYINSSSTYWNVYLYDPAQKEIYHYAYSGKDMEVKRSPEVGVAGGTYYVKVQKGSYSGLDYYLTANFTAGEYYEREWNEAYTDATAMTPNVLYKGSIMKTGDKDWYKVVLSQAGTLSLSFEHEYIDKNTTYWRVSLQDQNLKLLKSADFKGNQGATLTTEKVGVPAGTYYVQVQSSSLSTVPYGVKVNFESTNAWEMEFNDAPNMANVLALDTEVQGSIQNNNDSDWYTFTVPGNGYVYLTFSHAYLDSSNSYWYTYLYDQNEKEMVKRLYKGNTLTKVDVPWVGVKAGTYYVKVAKNYFSDLTYTLSVHFVSSGSFELEWNDSPETANPLKTGTAIMGALMESDDADFYSFTLQKADSFTLTFSHEYIDSTSTFWRVYLYDSVMKEVKRWSYTGKNTSITSDKVDLPAGTYYLKVVDNSYSQLPYTLLAVLSSEGTAPVTPAPVTPAPVTPAPVTPAPVTPVPVTPYPEVLGDFFPDEAFEEAVRDALGLDNEDEITADLCSKLERLNVSSLGIQSLQGISYFTNLTYLDCSGNVLTSLDVSSLKNLAYLDCSNNELTRLDLRQNKELVYLDVRGNNFASISSILLPGEIETFFFADEEEEQGLDAKITLNKTSATLYVGSSLKKLTLVPTLVKLTHAVSYTSSDTKVAKVSKKGVVTAKKKGTATITASVSQYGKTYTATCKVTVKNPTVSVSSKLKIKVGKKATLKVKTKPAGTITFTSQDPSIASVNSYGVVTGVKKGSTTIKVKCNGVTKKVKVTVKK